MKDTFPIYDIFQTLKKRILFIISITIGSIGIVAIITYYLLTPTYQSSSQFIVIQQQSGTIQFNINEIRSNVELINTYTEIMKSPFILEKVITKLNLPLTPEELSKRVIVTSGENSQVVTVSAIGKSPEEAARLANKIVEEFKTTIPSIMHIENVFVLSDANPTLSKEPIAPKPMINLIVATIIGLSTGIGLALLMELLNTKVKTESDIENIDITVLGVISVINKRKYRAISGQKSPDGMEEKSVET